MRILVVVATGVLAALFLYPFIWQVRTAFATPRSVFASVSNPFAIEPTFENFVRVLNESSVLRYMLNGVVVTSSILLGQLLVAIPAAFSLSRYRFTGQRLAMSAVIGALVFPGFVAAVPNFLLLSRLGLLDTYAALIIPFWGSAFGVFLFRQAIAKIPQDYLDSATIDGCNVAQKLTHVMVPLVQSHVAAFSIFSVVTHWNDLFWPLVVIRSTRLFTPPAGVVFYANSEVGSQWGPISAAAFIVVLPMIVLFLLVARRLDNGLAAAVLK